MPETQTFLKDKPYEFVPLLKSCTRIDYNSQPVREKCVYSGKLKLKITVMSHLHIGGGLRDYDDNGNIIKKQMRRNGKIIIPGSSLKGAVRSVAEAVSYSCAVKLPNDILKPVLPADNKHSCTGTGGLCMVCFMFGMMSQSGSSRGKVRFGEFDLESGKLEEKKIPALKSPFQNYPKNHDRFHSSKECSYGNERLYYCKACNTGNCENCTKEDYYQKIEDAGRNRDMGFRGRKFYSTKKELILENGGQTRYEMIAPGSVLKGEIIFENLRQEEGRLLAYALDIGHSFCMKLGYGKPLGYGKVIIDLERAESMESRYSSVIETESKLFEKWAQEYRTENTEEIKAAISELERIMSNENRFNTADSY